MARRKSDPKNNYVPTDYEDLYKYYVEGDGSGNSLVHQLIRRFLKHGSIEEKEAMAQAFMERAIDKDIISLFDPSKANFGGVIFFTVRTVCTNYLDRKSRNPLTGLNGGYLRTTSGEDTPFEPGVYNLDRVMGGEDPDYEKALDTKELVGRLLAWAAGMASAPRNKREESLYPMLQMMYLEESTPEECSKKLGVTTSTIHNWRRVIKEKLNALQVEMS